MKRQATNWAKLLAKHVSIKGFVSRIDEEFLQLTTKNSNKLTWRVTSSNIGRWKTFTWKEAQSRWLLGKCQWKPASCPTSAGTADFKETEGAKCWREGSATEPHTLRGGMWEGSTTSGSSLAVSPKATLIPLSEPPIWRLVFSQEREKHMYRQNCTQMLTAAFFVTARMMVVTAHRSISGRLHTQMGYSCTMEYYLAMKKEWTFATCNNRDESQLHYAEWGSPSKRLYPVWFHLQNILENL